MGDAQDRAILVAQRCSGQGMLMSSTRETQTSRVLGPARTPRTPTLFFGVLTRRLPCAALTAPLFLLCSTDVLKAPGPRVPLPGSRRAREVFCFAFVRTRGRAGVGGGGVWGGWGHSCHPAQGLGHPASPAGRPRAEGRGRALTRAHDEGRRISPPGAGPVEAVEDRTALARLHHLPPYRQVACPLRRGVAVAIDGDTAAESVAKVGGQRR